MRQVSTNFCCLLAGFLAAVLINHTLSKHYELGATSVPNLDYFILDDSFSEIQSAKAVLAGLSRRVLTELEIERCGQLRTVSSGTDHSDSKRAAYAQHNIEQLNWAVDEFKGTEQELVLTGNLLHTMWASEQYEGWLDTYLRLLYTHPTYDLVGTLVPDAFQIGSRLGRKEEVVQGLRFLQGIPFTCRAKMEAQKVLLSMPESGHLAAYIETPFDSPKP